MFLLLMDSSCATDDDMYMGFSQPSVCRFRGGYHSTKKVFGGTVSDCINKSNYFVVAGEHAKIGWSFVEEAGGFV